MLIDFHTHAYADNIAERAVSHLCEVAQIDSYTDGTEADLRAKLTEWNVDYGVMLPVATKPTQHVTINNWASSVNHGSLISFGTVHPDAADVNVELERIQSLGLKGVKLHPDYQNTYLFEEKMHVIFKRCAELGLPVIIHMGYDPVSPILRHAMPSHLAEISGLYPELKLIGAHMGGMMAWEEVYHYLAGHKNVWLDTSYTRGFINKNLMYGIIKKHGADRILFGSDCPWHTPLYEMEGIYELPLTSSEMDMVFYKNAAELLSIEI